MKQGWEYKKLGEVCEVVSGSTPKTNVPEYWGKGHYWVTPAELNETIVYIDKTERQITDEALAKTKLRLLPVGTVLLSSRAPIGKVAITKTEMYCNQGFKNCICSDSIYNKYLFYFLRLKKEYLNSLGRGATFKEISKSIVESISIPLPPKSTQLAIVSELDKINELIRLKKEQLKDFDNLAQSIFYEMFGDPVENEMGWEVKKLGEIGEVKTGNTPSRSNVNFYNEKFIEWIKTDNIRNEQMNPTTAAEYLSREGAECGRIVSKGSILVACIAGSLSSIGKCCITTKNVAFNQQINAITPYEEFCNSIYLYELIRNSSKYIQQNATTGMKHILSKSIFEKMKFPLPPLTLQHLFAHRIEQIEHQKSEVQNAITDLETLLASRMQYWFE